MEELQVVLQFVGDVTFAALGKHRAFSPGMGVDGFDVDGSTQEAFKLDLHIERRSNGGLRAHER